MADHPGAARRALLPATLAAALSVVIATACLGEEPAAKVCSTCKGTGKIPCPAHTYSLKGKFQLVCSRCNLPSCCNGLGWTPCPKCKREDIKQEYDGALAAWKDEAKHELGYPDKLGENTARAATRHFRIQGPFTHPQFHDYGEKLERCHAYFQDIFGENADADLPWTKCQICVFEQHATYEKFVRSCAGGERADAWLELALKSSGLRHPTIPCSTTYINEAGHGRRKDDDVQHGLIHNVAHIYLETYKTGNRSPAWLGEGFAGHCEIVVLGSPEAYCVEYGSAGSHNRNRWRALLKSAVDKGKLRDFEELSRVQLAEMNEVDGAQAIAVVDVLVTKKDKFVKFVLAQKDGTGAVEALKEHYQLEPRKLRMWWYTRLH